MQNPCIAQTDYGAEEANTSFFFGAKQLDEVDDYNYLALRDHKGPSGVPLGGIGTGCFDFAPDGSFTRIGLTNTHNVMDKKAGRGCFFTLWERSDGRTSVRRLIRDDDVKYGIPGYKHTTYTGLFPTAKVLYDNEAEDNIKVSIYAYSGLVPQNIKDSALPVVWFDVTLTADKACEASLALSWEDFIGRGLFDPDNLDGLEGQILKQGRNKKVNAPAAWPAMKRVPTASRIYENGSWKGILQFAREPIIPRKATFQNYVSQVAVIADTANGATVSTVSAYNLDNGDAVWPQFISTGAFDTEKEESTLSRPDGSDNASVVAINTRLAKGERKTIRFMVVWYYPELVIDRQKAHPGSYWSTGDYGRYFHNFFNEIDILVSYAVKERERILKQTVEWHKPILNSTMPDWLKFKLINSAYVIYTNSMLNRSGDFTVMEGAMGGLAGTMDQRISAHPFYQKFFTQLDRNEMQRFADCQSPEGYILHFLGHYYVGMAPKGGPAPTEGGWMLDNTAGWMLQLAKDYAQTGEIEYLRHNADRFRKALNHLKSQMPEGVQIPIGRTTYDDYDHPPVYCYMAGVWLATLKAAAYVAEALADEQLARECSIQYQKSYRDAMRLLWNGRFFAYGCEVDGSNRRDDLMFTGQLAGQFISRYWGYGDILPMEVVEASLISQFKTSLSHSPDYYANKVWDLNLNKGIDRPGSQCWPFYLESYTAMPAIQAGYAADGLEIMRHIQLVHMRLGYTWSQNLWNPGPVTYMTAPVTWFITDLLAGSNLDVPSGTLWISPVPVGDDQQIKTPVYFPTFWASLECDTKSGKAGLKVLKTLSQKTIVISQLRCEPIGIPASEGKTIKIPSFEIKEGAVLDLSPYWDRIWTAKSRKAVLPRADEIDFITVNQ